MIISGVFFPLLSHVVEKFPQTKKKTLVIVKMSFSLPAIPLYFYISPPPRPPPLLLPPPRPLPLPLLPPPPPSTRGLLTHSCPLVPPLQAYRDGKIFAEIMLKVV